MRSLILIFFIAMQFCSCMHSPSRFSEKKFVIGAKQTVRVAEIGMSVTNEGCGRKWIGNEERPYCDISVRFKDSIYHFGESFAPLFILNYKLEIEKMNPWGREEDSVPAGGCRINIVRLDDLSR
jgi:hypothetical protein